MWKTGVIVVVVASAALAAGCGGGNEETDLGSAAEPVSGMPAGGSGIQALGLGGAGASAQGITVVGSGSAKVVPDMAQWSFGVQTSAETADAALSESSEAMKRILDALRNAGVAKADLRTEQVSVYPRTSDDGRSIVGYDASTSVWATVRDLGRSGAIVDAAVAAGANQVSGPSLTVSDAEAQYADAVDAAFDDARARAEAIAAKAGVTLGAPLAIVDGGGGGMPVPYYERAVADAAAAEMPVEPGVQEVGATLTVVFAIG
jgi:uncharacterized protein YggE